jgi:acetyl-CoA synthetase
MGWITGHSYGVYGPLLNNMTSVIFEGIPGYPDHRRFYDILSRYQVDTFYSTPTIIRELAREGDSHLEGYNLSSLRLLGSVGEPISPETWKWYYNVLGKGRCPVIDTYWQTETGGHVLTPMPGVAPLKPGFCSFPFFGIDPVILDDTGDKIASPEQEGVLCIKKPWPGMARSIYGNHDLFVDTYFRQAPEMYFSSDAARIDDEGHFRIIGRVDEVINVAGYRFGTAEIESALMEHQSVAEVAVVGHPHPIKVQGIYAFVTLRPGIQKTETLKTELAEMVLKEIGVIASVDMIQWADALPKTRSGKIVRRILSKVASGQTEDLGDTTGLSDPAVIQQLIQGHI